MTGTLVQAALAGDSVSPGPHLSSVVSHRRGAPPQRGCLSHPHPPAGSSAAESNREHWQGWGLRQWLATFEQGEPLFTVPGFSRTCAPASQPGPRDPKLQGGVGLYSDPAFVHCKSSHARKRLIGSACSLRLPCHYPAAGQGHGPSFWLSGSSSHLGTWARPGALQSSGAQRCGEALGVGVGPRGLQAGALRARNLGKRHSGQGFLSARHPARHSVRRNPLTRHCHLMRCVTMRRKPTSQMGKLRWCRGVKAPGLHSVVELAGSLALSDSLPASLEVEAGATEEPEGRWWLRAHAEGPARAGAEARRRPRTSEWLPGSSWEGERAGSRHGAAREGPQLVGGAAPA